jgi:hypothetical protein
MMDLLDDLACFIFLLAAAPASRSSAPNRSRSLARPARNQHRCHRLPPAADPAKVAPCLSCRRSWPSASDSVSAPPDEPGPSSCPRSSALRKSTGHTSHGKC